MLEHYMMFAAYNRWANDIVYRAAADLSETELCADTGIFFKSVLATLNHLLAADRIWLKRFTGSGEAPATLDAQLFADLAGLKAARGAEDHRIIDWIAGLTPQQLAATFTYVPVTTPEPVTQRLSPALAHFFNHQTHHRGQVHSALTALGRPSVVLDLISFQRTPEGIAFR
ncbi:MAG: DinB family protein [Allorhizobium sp.]